MIIVLARSRREPYNLKLRFIVEPTRCAVERWIRWIQFGGLCWIAISLHCCAVLQFGVDEASPVCSACSCRSSDGSVRVAGIIVAVMAIAVAIENKRGKKKNRGIHF